MKTTVLGLAVMMLFSGTVPGNVEKIIPYSSVVALREIANEEDIKEVDVLAVGDIMVHYPQLKSAYIGEDRYDFNPVFEHVKNYIESADLAIANLETVIAPSRKPYAGYPRFNSPSELIEALRKTGFDLLVTANNHSLDQGKTGLVETIEAIKKTNLGYVGTSLESEKRYTVWENDGIRIGIASFATALNGLESLLSVDERRTMINLYSETMVSDVLDELDSENVDFVIVYIHWGNEYQLKASSWQRETASFLLNSGVDLILGSHPHVVQELEGHLINGKMRYVVYSMGNFISNQRNETLGNPHTEDGLMATFKFQKDSKSGRADIVDVAVIPTFVHRFSQGGVYQYRILSEQAILSFDEHVQNRARSSFNRTINQIGN